MCGILGISSKYSKNINVKKCLIDINHRGPDSSGVYKNSSKKVIMGHVRLSINDLSVLGHQPMISSSERYIISYNGEIYNFKELHSKYFDDDHNFKGSSDTEVLIELLDKFGLKILDELNGIFAFSLYDKKEDCIYLVRDRYGVKPLYYFDNKDYVCFSSEIRGIKTLIHEPLGINLEAIYRSYIFQWNPSNDTYLKGIMKVPPGFFCKIKNGKLLNLTRWFKPYVLSKVYLTHRDTSSICKKIRTTLKNAVHNQLVSDVPVGALLSGGLDSSAIVE